MVSVCDVLRDFIPFIQFKEREKHLWKSVTFSKVAGFQPATLLKVTLLLGSFSRFLNCTNGTKSRNASHFWIMDHCKYWSQFVQFSCSQCYIYPSKTSENLEVFRFFDVFRGDKNVILRFSYLYQIIKIILKIFFSLILGQSRPSGSSLYQRRVYSEESESEEKVRLNIFKQYQIKIFS